MNRFLQVGIISLILLGLVACQRGEPPVDVEATAEAEEETVEVEPTISASSCGINGFGGWAACGCESCFGVEL